MNLLLVLACLAQDAPAEEAFKKIEESIEKAKTVLDPAANAKAWGELDKRVTDQSYFVTWLWDNQIGLESTNVKGVSSRFNSGAWDLTFSSFKK